MHDPRRMLGLSFLMTMLLPVTLSAQPALKEKISIGGTGAALGGLQLVAEGFQKEGMGTADIAPSMGSSGGIKAVSNGALDLAVSSRPLTDEERAGGLEELQYAETLFVPIAHLSVPVDNITRADIVGALLGSRTTWPNGERVRFVLRPESDADSQLLRSLSPEVSRAVDAARKREGMVVAMTDQQNAETIERTPGTIGFSSLSVVVAERRAVKVLALDGIRSEDPSYRLLGLMKPLYLIMRADMPAGARSFVRFLLSPRGRKILERAGNLPTEGAHATR